MTGSIDDSLDEWFKRSFPQPRRGSAMKRTITRTKVASAKSEKPPRGSMHVGRTKLVSTIRKAPEVMVKISGGGRGVAQIKAHFDYISRNGQVELENEDGQMLLGREAMRDLRDEWQLGQYGIPESGRCKQAFNIVLSMPPGTNRDAVKSAARDFALRQFGSNHPFVFTEHADEAHPHVHLCVKAMGNDGTRLNPRKADLQRWREEFAQSLREQGIAANATKRVARGVVRKGVQQQVLQMERRGQRSTAVDGRRRAMAEEMQAERAQSNPMRQLIDESRRQVVAAYGEAARLLASSPQVDDRRLALEIVEFVREMPPVLPAREVASEKRQKRGERGGCEQGVPEERVSKPREIVGHSEEKER